MFWRTKAHAKRRNSGQATVEAAVLVPVLFTVMLMLIQPGIILYDRMVMNAAAAEGCRLVTTKCSDGAYSNLQYLELVKRHLGAVPQHELFHIHEGGCTWDVLITGSEHSRVVSVRIQNTIRLLPLLDAGVALLGISRDGRYTFAVEQTARVMPEWQESR